MALLLRTACLLAGCLVVVLGGCSTPSLNPIYTDELTEVVADDRVVGEWTDARPGKGENRYIVSRAGSEKDAERPKQYVLRIREKGEGTGPGESVSKAGEFEVRLVRLGTQDHADFSPASGERNRLGERYGLAALPVHVIMPVAITDEGITVRPLANDKVRAFLEGAPKVTPFAMQGDIAVLTGTSRQVQDFFRRVVQGEDVFGESIVLSRAAAEAVPKSEEPKDSGKGKTRK